MAEYALLGKRIPKPDAVNRVTGRMVYADDMTLPGVLAGKILGSPVAHGRIRRLDVSKAASLPGVRAVVTVPVVPGPTILSPKAGASLARTANMTVTYVPGLSAGVSGEINQPQGAGGEFATSGTQSDNGTYSMPLPSHLKPGPGWIILYRQMVIAPSGTGFRSVKVIDNAAGTAIQVQWV